MPLWIRIVRLPIDQLWLELLLLISQIYISQQLFQFWWQPFQFLETSFWAPFSLFEQLWLILITHRLVYDVPDVSNYNVQDSLEWVDDFRLFDDTSNHKITYGSWFSCIYFFISYLLLERYFQILHVSERKKPVWDLSFSDAICLCRSDSAWFVMRKRS